MSQAGSILGSGGSGGGSFAPNKTITEFDDFLDNSTATNKLQWATIGSLDPSASFTRLNTNPGQLIYLSSNSHSGLTLSPGDTALTAPFQLGSGTFNMNWVMDLTTLSVGGARYTIYIGLLFYADVAASSPPTSGVYFQYSDNVNAGNWQIVCNNSSTSTTHNTSTPAATGFHNYGIQINAAATSAAFTINGVIVANSPITTNFPTLPVGPGFFSLASSGTLPAQVVDLFYYTQVLTTAR